MKDRGLPAESTIYNYTLVHKKALPRLFPPLYALGFTVLFGVLVYLNPAGIAAIAAAIPVTLILHFSITKIFLKLTLDTSLPLWRLRWLYPWIGWFPLQHVALRSFAKLHTHLLFVGLACVGMLYYTFSAAALWMLLITHIWLMLPRLWVLWNARTLKKSVLLKITKTEISFYIS